jgi:hypothetical protein
MIPLVLAGCGWVTEAEFEARRDRDGDGYAALQFGGSDCDDRATRIHPDADDVAGDGVDADCDGRDGPPPPPPPEHTADPAHTGETAHTGESAHTGLPASELRLTINEVLADGAVDANCDGVVDADDDEFVELVNTGPVPIALVGGTVSDGATVRHELQPRLLLPGEVLVVFGGSGWGGNGPDPWCGQRPYNAYVQIASSGGLDLDDDGDSLVVEVAGVTTSVAWGTDGGTGTSLNRNPDLTGPDALVRHTTVPGNGGACSPMRAVDQSELSP